MKNLLRGIYPGLLLGGLLGAAIMLGGCPRGASDNSGHDTSAAYHGSHEHATFHPSSDAHRSQFRPSTDRPMFKSSASRPAGHSWLSGGGAHRGGRK